MKIEDWRLCCSLYCMARIQQQPVWGECSVQDGIYALAKALMRCTQSLRSFPDAAFETVEIQYSAD